MCSCCCHGKGLLCSIYGCHFIKSKQRYKRKRDRFLMFSSVGTHQAATSSWFFFSFFFVFVLSAVQPVSAGALQSGSDLRSSGRIVKKKKSHQAKRSYNVMSHHCWCGCWSEDQAERDMLTFRLFFSAPLKLRTRPRRNSVSASAVSFFFFKSTNERRMRD